MAHLSNEQIAAYRARSLDADELLRASDHLAQCEECRALVLGSPRLAADAAAMRRNLKSGAGAVTHLTYDQISASVDGELTGAEADAVNAHARDCAACAADLRGIRQLKTQIDAGRPAVDRPGRTADFWRMFQGWRLFGVTAAAAGCVLVAFLATRQREPVPMAQVMPTPGTSTPAAASAVIRDGNRAFAIAANGKLAGLDGLPEKYRSAVEQALAARRVDTPAVLGELASKRDVLLGPSTASHTVELQQPMGTIVESQRPLFTWQPVANAEYQVSVYDSEFQQAAASDWMREHEWRPSADLRRGVRYQWQLTVRLGGSEFTVPEPPAPEARFRVLDAASESGLAGLRSAWSDSHLVMGVAYAQAGLLDEARRELRMVADQNPDASGLAALLESVKRSGVSSPEPRSK